MFIMIFSIYNKHYKHFRRNISGDEEREKEREKETLDNATFAFLIDKKSCLQNVSLKNPTRIKNYVI